MSEVLAERGQQGLIDINRMRHVTGSVEFDRTSNHLHEVRMMMKRSKREEPL